MTFAEIVLNSRNIPYPAFRFVAWEFLSIESQTTAESLGYTQELWNVPDSNTVELIGFEDLGGPAQIAVLSLGFEDSEQWDCWINHYEYFDWDQLIEKGVDEYYRALGWNENNWQSLDSSTFPDTATLPWADLTIDEQGNATELCYFEQIWDGADITTWTTAPPTSAPTASFQPSLSLAPSMTPTTESSNEPSMEPTSMPVLAPTANSVRGIPIPYFRYILYQYLSESAMTIAMSLGYTADTWDNPGTEEIEFIGFKDLGLAKSAAEQLGFTDPEVWDCWINHYRYYEWEELTNFRVQQYYKALGYNDTNWGSSQPDLLPEVATMFWDDLTDYERGNATQVCYIQELWDEEPLRFWTTAPPTTSPTLFPTTTISPSEMPTKSPAPSSAPSIMPSAVPPPATNSRGVESGAVQTFSFLALKMSILVTLVSSLLLAPII